MTIEQEPQYVIQPLTDGTYIQFGIPDVPYSAVRIPIGADYSWYLAEAATFREQFRATFASPAPAEYGGPVYGNEPPPPPEPDQPRHAPAARSQGPQRAPQGQPAYLSERCDSCGGPVAFKDGFTSKAGKKISPSLTCGANCVDKGKYPHHVRWLEAADFGAL